jgi:BirA family biotin operon repressor/biotin-[acetyl-CoA-carboxylase] ligase
MPDGASNCAPDGPHLLNGIAGTRFRRIEWFSEIDSTNAYALAAARRGEPEGLVVVADHQTAGRGRLGRSWLAPRGASLLVSLLLRPKIARERWPLLGTAVAVAAVDAVVTVCDLPARVKWPNDVLVRGRKLAGVLAEADVSPANGLGAVVVGMGLNVAWESRPPELADIATAVSLERGRVVPRALLLSAWLARVERWIRAVEQEPDAARVLWAARANSATLGTRVRVERAHDVLVGEAVDLDDRGALVVARDDGTRIVVTVGDVVHVRPDQDTTDF